MYRSYILNGKNRQALLFLFWRIRMCSGSYIVNGDEKMKFEDLNLNKDLVKAINELGIIKPTNIQEETIPLAEKGFDIVGISKTGSGKTLAFSLPILEKIIPGVGIQALILAPTRELAVQISTEIGKFSKYKKCSVATIFGGVSLAPQIDAITSADVIVGTPGRILDHLSRRTLDIRNVKYAVLDEADKMVEMGFIEDVSRILDHTGQDKQVYLFGATISEEIQEIEKKYMKNPKTIKTSTQVQEQYLQQFYYDVKPQEKFSLLIHLLKNEAYERAIIFCSTRMTVDIVAKNLTRHSVDCESIHGKLSQSRRLRVIENFNKGKIKLLIASAVAARGLDIKDVTHVINYDLPQDPQEYIHRIGRTARAGETGKAITLLSHKDYAAFAEIQERYPLEINKLEAKNVEKQHFRARESPKRSFYRKPLAPKIADRSWSGMLRR
jgi:superfamily II DNA/RNA helicase